jgi:hypothetical protein
MVTKIEFWKFMLGLVKIFLKLSKPTKEGVSVLPGANINTVKSVNPTIKAANIGRYVINANPRNAGIKNTYAARCSLIAIIDFSFFSRLNTFIRPCLSV